MQVRAMLLASLAIIASLANVESASTQEAFPRGPYASSWAFPPAVWTTSSRA